MLETPCFKIPRFQTIIFFNLHPNQTLGMVPFYIIIYLFLNKYLGTF